MWTAAQFVTEFVALYTPLFFIGELVDLACANNGGA
jgi:hypothetical protein